MKRYRVLFLPSWYPSPAEPLNGIFVKKHAEAAAMFSEVGVLYVTLTNDRRRKRYDLIYTRERGVLTVRVLCRAVSIHIPKISYLINMMRYLKGALIGLKLMRNIWGEPEIVHVSVAWPAGLIALFLNFFKKTPYIITEHYSGYTAFQREFERMADPIRKIIRLMFRRTGVVTTVSGYLMGSLKRLGLVQGESAVVANVVDIQDEFEFIPKDDRTIKILTVSLLVDKVKNISGLISAFSEVVCEHKNAELHIVGDGKDRGMLEDLAADLGLLDENVFFHGYVPNKDLYKYFAESHFFVLNSNYETFSVVTAEAIGYGLPVVVTRCGGPEEFVNERVGILVERRNKKGLVEGLRYMIKNWHTYNPRKLHNYIKNICSREAVGRRFFEIYNGVLSNRVRRKCR